MPRERLSTFFNLDDEEYRLMLNIGFKMSGRNEFKENLREILESYTFTKKEVRIFHKSKRSIRTDIRREGFDFDNTKIIMSILDELMNEYSATA